MNFILHFWCQWEPAPCVQPHVIFDMISGWGQAPDFPEGNMVLLSATLESAVEFWWIEILPFPFSNPVVRHKL